MESVIGSGWIDEGPASESWVDVTGRRQSQVDAVRWSAITDRLLSTAAEHRLSRKPRGMNGLPLHPREILEPIPEPIEGSFRRPPPPGGVAPPRRITLPYCCPG